MKKLLMPALLALGACGYRDFRSEGYSKYYPQPNEATDHSHLDRKKILAWAKDPKAKERIGYLEKYEMTLAGSRRTTEYYIIKDRHGLEQLGYINDIGEVFRYHANGTMTKIGEYPVVDLGVKMFFGLPIEHNILFEGVDPYRD